MFTKHPRAVRKRAAAIVGIAAVVCAAGAGGQAAAAPRAAQTDGAQLDAKNVVLNVGSDESQRDLAWYSASSTASCVQVAQVRGASDAFSRATTDCKTTTGAATNEPGLHWYHAALADLKPSTDYAYRVGSATDGWSKTYRFTTGNKGNNFNFTYYGDPQIYPTGAKGNPAAGWQKTLTQSVSSTSPEFLFTAGDQVDSYNIAKQPAEWSLFLQPAQLTEVPLATTVGNHDDALNNGVHQGVLYGEHFALPNVSTTQGVSATGTGDYWFTYNGALFMVLNSNATDANGKPDVAGHEAFMTAALQANPAATWRIVSFHHAPFSSADHTKDADVVNLRQQLTPVLSDLHVDLVLNGHDHDYARSYLMTGDQAVANTGAQDVYPTSGEVLYIATNSASGGKFYPLTCPADTDKSGTACNGQYGYPWTAAISQEKVPNYTDVEVSPNSLAITTYRVTDVPATNNSVVDTVTLHRAGR